MENNILISLCMIVKNEAPRIEQVLNSVKDFADEIIIVDTGSNDNTKELASKFTDKIYDFEWVEDFSRARNFSFSKASGEYIMWLDADDFIPKEELEKLQQLKSQLDKNIDIYMLKYIHYDGINPKPNFEFYRERIVRNDRKFKWIGAVHEYINLIGNIEYKDISIVHERGEKTDLKRNLKIFQKKIKNGEDLTPRDLYYFARELYDNGYYKKAIIYLNKFLKTDSWIEDLIGAIELKAICLMTLKRYDDSIDCLLKSLKICDLRANICCLLADNFLVLYRHKLAIYWYNMALSCQKDEECGFVNNDYFSYYPNIKLAICYYELGNIDMAKECNEKALKEKPNDYYALKNKEFFDGI